MARSRAAVEEIAQRLERCFEQSLGERRELIGRWISQFGATIESQNQRIIAAARKQLGEALDSFERETFL